MFVTLTDQHGKDVHINMNNVIKFEWSGSYTKLFYINGENELVRDSEYEVISKLEDKRNG